MRNKEKVYRYITIWTDDTYPDIIMGTYANKLEIDLGIAQELIKNRLDYCENRPAFTLIDFTNVKSVTKEARDYMNSPEGGLKHLLGGAFLSNNVVATLFVNLYLKVSEPVIPAKFFNRKDEALQWLKQLKNKTKGASLTNAAN